MPYEYKPTIAHRPDVVRASRTPCNERNASDDKLLGCDAKLRTEAKNKPHSTTATEQNDGSCSELPRQGECNRGVSAQDEHDPVNHPQHNCQCGHDAVNHPQHYCQGEHDAVNHPLHYCQNDHDPVNHPSHYCQGGIECIDAIQAAVTGLKGMEAVCVGNVIRYIWRWKWKNGKEDLHKARFYLNKLILLVESAQKQSEREQTEQKRSEQKTAEQKRTEQKRTEHKLTEQEQTKQKGWVSTYAQKESTNGCGR